jgi:hypothetical protein
MSHRRSTTAKPDLVELAPEGNRPPVIANGLERSQMCLRSTLDGPGSSDRDRGVKFA